MLGDRRRLDLIVGLLLGALAAGCNCNDRIRPHNDFDSGPPQPVCGDGVIDGTEQCDGANLGGQTCQSLGFIGGALACTPGCQLDTSNCSRLCGNGTCDPLEECDGTNLCGNQCADWGVYTCDPTCHLVKSACTTTLYTVSAQADLLNVPILRFGKSLTAPWMDLGIAVPLGDPGPIVEIDRYDPTLILARDRTLGLAAGFSPPFVYQDVDGDGTTDVLVADSSGTQVMIWYWDSANGKFAEILTAVGCTVDEYGLGDLNEDGKPDIVIGCSAASDAGVSSEQRIGVLPSGQSPPFSAVTWLSVSEPIQGIQVLKANADAHLDISFRRVTSNALGVLAGDGKLGFTALADTAVGSVVGRPHLVDLDADGLLDLVVEDPANLKLHLYPGTGVLTFGTAVDVATLGTPIDLHVVDLDLDGLPDISFASQGQGALAAFKNLGTAGPARFNFRPQYAPVPGMTFTSFDVGDFNGDGDMDAVVGGSLTPDAGTGARIVFLQNNVH